MNFSEMLSTFVAWCVIIAITMGSIGLAIKATQWVLTLIGVL